MPNVIIFVNEHDELLNVHAGILKPGESINVPLREEDGELVFDWEAELPEDWEVRILKDQP